MSTKWKKVAIENIYLDLYDGPHATPKPSDEGPIFLGIKNITDDGWLDLSEIRHISEKDFPKWTKRVTPQPGDIVFTYEATLNRYAIIPKGFRGCLGRRVALIRPDPTKVDTRFLHHYFFGKEWRATIAQNMIPGSTVDRIPLIHFPKFEVSLPPLPTQRKIAAMLSAYDDLIENNTRRIAVLEEMARLLYQEWFVRFRFPGYEDVAMVDGIPEGWTIRCLDEVCESIKDGDWIETKDQGGNDYRLLQVSNIGMGEFIETGNYRYVTQETFDRLRCTEITPGDILVSRMPKPIGRAWLVTEMPWRMITAVDVAIIKADSSVTDSLYLTYYLNSPEHLALVSQHATGTTRPRISRRNLSALPVTVPSRDLQLKFQDFASVTYDMMNTLRHRNNILRRTRDLLLPRLVSGQVDVSKMPIVVTRYLD